MTSIHKNRDKKSKNPARSWWDGEKIKKKNEDGKWEIMNLHEIGIINHNYLVFHQTHPHPNSIKPSVHLHLVFHQILTSCLIQEVDDMEYYYLMCFLVSLIDSADFLTA